MALGLALFDIIDIFIPPVCKPVWEFQTLTNLVERAPVPCWGWCYLSGEKNLRIFKFLSWASLVAGVFVLLVPLGVSSGFRSISKTISNSVANSTNRRHRWNSYGIYWAKLRHPKSSVVFCLPQPPNVRQRLESWASKSQLFQKLPKLRREWRLKLKQNEQIHAWVWWKMRLNPSWALVSGIVFQYLGKTQ